MIPGRTDFLAALHHLVRAVELNSVGPHALIAAQRFEFFIPPGQSIDLGPDAELLL